MVPGFFIVYATSQKCIFLYILYISTAGLTIKYLHHVENFLRHVGKPFSLHFYSIWTVFDDIKAYSLLFFIGYILFSYCFLRLQRKVHKYKCLKCAKIQLLTERVSHHRC